MKLLLRFAAVAVSIGCTAIPGAITAQSDTEIGGQKVVTITRKAVSTNHPEFTSITLAPGRGMEILQITANFPGKGDVNVLASPDLAGAKQMLDVKGRRLWRLRLPSRRSLPRSSLSQPRPRRRFPQ